MRTQTPGGLTGKARRVHHRRHAERKFAEQLMVEYLEPDIRSRHRRTGAPIRGRCEFMPTFFAEADMADKGKDAQFELTWDEGRRDKTGGRRSGERRVVWSTGEASTEPERAVVLIKVPPAGALGAGTEQSESTAREAQPVESPTTIGGNAEEGFDVSSKHRVLRIPRRSTARMPLGWSKAPVRQPGSGLSVRGFAVGCALGGVAAAIVLIVVSVALG